MWYIVGALGIAAVVVFVYGTLMLECAEKKLEENNRRLLYTLKQYSITLRIYRDILKIMKDKGVDISNCGIRWETND